MPSMVRFLARLENTQELVESGMDSSMVLPQVAPGPPAVGTITAHWCTDGSTADASPFFALSSQSLSESLSVHGATPLITGCSRSYPTAGA